MGVKNAWLYAYGSSQAILSITELQDMSRYGHPAKEKADTYRLRQEHRQEACERAERAPTTLQDRLTQKKRIGKHHISTAKKHIKSALYWMLHDRQAFVDYMAVAQFVLAMAIISGNDYISNIPTLGIQTSALSSSVKAVIFSIVKKYLTLPEVVHKADKDTWSLMSFNNAIKVFDA
ncbi:hypothetical protein BG004_000790 [Podila humilis]|nr:hypothetical protein BG004_000790 [Podila humilis]